MKFKQVITVIGLGASLAAATTACGTKEEAVTTMTETETVAEVATETQTVTESESQTLEDEGLTDADIRAELEKHKEEIKKACYDHKSVGFVEYDKALRLNGTDGNNAVAETIAHFDELNSAMGKLETETETQTGEVYVSGTPVGEEVGTGSNATSGELSKEQIAEEKAAEEAAKKEEAEAKRQAEEAQKQAEAQTPVQQAPAQPNFRNSDETHDYDAMRQAGYSEEQIQWQMEVDATLDKGNPNYGRSGQIPDEVWD